MDTLYFEVSIMPDCGFASEIPRTCVSRASFIQSIIRAVPQSTLSVVVAGYDPLIMGNQKVVRILEERAKETHMILPQNETPYDGMPNVKKLPIPLDMGYIVINSLSCGMWDYNRRSTHHLERDTPHEPWRKFLRSVTLAQQLQADFNRKVHLLSS